MEFSFEDRQRSRNSSSSKQGLASDRLQKAIERNRRKQTKRAAPIDSPRSATTAASESKRTSRTSRRSVGKAETTTFSTAPRRPIRKPPAPVTYAAASRPISRTRKKSKKASNIQEYLVKGVWVFCGILALRLIFSDGGVIDYYSRQKNYEGKVREYESVIEDNKKIAIEIEKIKLDPSYQRKLVRDHLGFIAPDEYLILFPKVSQNLSN